MAGGDLLISPGLGVGLFFIVAIFITTLLVCCLRRRSQNKLYKRALERQPNLTRAEFRARQKAEYAGDRVNEERYELGIREVRWERKQAKKVAKAQRAAKAQRLVGYRMAGEPLISDVRDGDAGGTGEPYTEPYSQEWRERQAALLRERRQHAATFERGGGLRAGTWAEDVNAEMDLGLRRTSLGAGDGDLAPDELMVVPARDAPPTWRHVESDDLPRYTPELLPPYTKTADSDP